MKPLAPLLLACALTGCGGSPPEAPPAEEAKTAPKPPPREAAKPSHPASRLVAVGQTRDQVEEGLGIPFARLREAGREVWVYPLQDGTLRVRFTAAGLVESAEVAP